MIQQTAQSKSTQLNVNRDTAQSITTRQIEPSATSKSNPVDVITQFRANLQQVEELQQRLGFVLQEITYVVNKL